MCYFDKWSCNTGTLISDHTATNMLSTGMLDLKFSMSAPSFVSFLFDHKRQIRLPWENILLVWHHFVFLCFFFSVIFMKFWAVVLKLMRWSSPVMDLGDILKKKKMLMLKKTKVRVFILFCEPISLSCFTSRILDGQSSPSTAIFGGCTNCCTLEYVSLDSIKKRKPVLLNYTVH